MKLLRYGPKGQEKPGIVDAEGNVRDLSAEVADINGAALSDAALAEALLNEAEQDAENSTE